ncbi:PH domain-containing protein [Halapricum salinum]|nr:PH domain-containing protein [Halapricum salinum]
MGLFSQDDDDIVLENADLNCEPQGPSVTKSDVAKIDQHLSPGEKVHYLSTGNRFSINGEEKQTMKLRLALTDRRILLKRKQKLIGNEQQTFNYEDISSVNLRKGMVFKKIAIETQSATYGIGVTNSHDSNELQAMVNFIREKSRSSRGAQDGSAGGETDPLDRIDKLKELNEKGAISDEEFEQKKDDLLDQV